MQFHEEKGLDKRRKIGYTCKADDFYRQEAAGNVQGFAICHAAGLLRRISDTASVSAELYYCADLSLSEIAEIVGITRQGVRDGIKRGEQILQEMEDKLQFAARFNALRENYSAIASTLQSIQTQTADQPQVQTACREAMEAVHHGLELL